MGRKAALRDSGLLIGHPVFPFQAAFPKGTTAAAVASACSPRGCRPVLFEDVPERRFKVALPGQQVFEKLNAEKLDGLFE